MFASCYMLPWLSSLYASQEENDNEYEEEPEVADVFDSDFDEDVSAKLL